MLGVAIKNVQRVILLYYFFLKSTVITIDNKKLKKSKKGLLNHFRHFRLFYWQANSVLGCRGVEAWQKSKYAFSFPYLVIQRIAYCSVVIYDRRSSVLSLLISSLALMTVKVKNTFEWRNRNFSAQFLNSWNLNTIASL